MQFNTNNSRKIPINRNNLFFSDESFLFEEDLAYEYISQDMNQTVILYEVDLERSNLNQTYFESEKNNIVFKTPVELHVIYKINDSQLKSYETNKNLGNYIKPGTLNIRVLQKTLDENNCDIKIGDYIGIQVSETHLEMYTVINDGRVNYDNKHTIYGIKPFYRNIDCAPVDNNEFNGV